MSALTEGRSDLADALSDADFIVCHDHVPEDFNAPCLIVQPGDSYVLLPPDDETFGADVYAQALEVWICLEVVTNSDAANETDRYVEHVLTNLPHEWGLDAISRPAPIVTAGWSGHGCRISVSRHITL